MKKTKTPRPTPPAVAGATAAKPAAKKPRRQRPAPPPEEEFEELEEFEDPEEADDFGYDDYSDDGGHYDDYSAPALPTRKRKKSSKKKADTKTKAAKTDDENAIPPKVLYSLFGVSAVVGCIIIGLIVRSIMNAGDGRVIDMAVPTEFTKWTHERGGLSLDSPKGWQVKSGGGTGGVPPWVSFEQSDQGVHISLRGSVSGTAVSDIASAGGTVPIDLGGEIPDELDPIAGVHRYQSDKIGSEYDEYEESEPETIESRFGEGRISDFKGTKLFSATHGVRATLVSNQYQFNVICRCPEDRLEEYKPIFKRIIGSTGS